LAKKDFIPEEVKDQNPREAGWTQEKGKTNERIAEKSRLGC